MNCKHKVWYSSIVRSHDCSFQAVRNGELELALKDLGEEL